MKRFLAAPIAAVALVIFASAALAGPMSPGSVVWSYNWTPSSPAIYSDQGTSAGVLVSNDQPVAGVTGSSIIDATKLTVFSATPTPTTGPNAGINPNTFNTSGGYGLSLKLWLGNSSTAPTNPADFATFNFQGKLNGSFSSNNSLIGNGFGAGGNQASQTESVTLGGYVFTVSLNSFTPPGPPITSGPPVVLGSVSALVTITPAIGPAGVPEPSTMLLSSMGLMFLGGAAWRKRRQSAPAALSA